VLSEMSETKEPLSPSHNDKANPSSGTSVSAAISLKRVKPMNRFAGDFVPSVPGEVQIGVGNALVSEALSHFKEPRWSLKRAKVPYVPLPPPEKVTCRFQIDEDSCNLQRFLGVFVF
jgi:hypothetical protein